MKKLGALLGIVGVALLAIGIYFKITLNSNGYGSTSSALVMALAREMGMYQSSNLSTWDTVKLWFVENHMFCIVAGPILMVLAYVMNRIIDKRAYNKVLENSANVGTWRCNCGEINKNSKVTCTKCGAFAPKADTWCCTKCGENNKNSKATCAKCGAFAPVKRR